eukprot:15188-Heterococcus_DN1.PRE.6
MSCTHVSYRVARHDVMLTSSANSATPTTTSESKRKQAIENIQYTEHQVYIIPRDKCPAIVCSMAACTSKYDRPERLHYSMI